eukprot:s4424_g3.t1
MAARSPKPYFRAIFFHHDSTSRRACAQSYGAGQHTAWAFPEPVLQRICSHELSFVSELRLLPDGRACRAVLRSEESVRSCVLVLTADSKTGRFA